MEEKLIAIGIGLIVLCFAVGFIIRMAKFLWGFLKILWRIFLLGIKCLPLSFAVMCCLITPWYFATLSVLVACVIYFIYFRHKIINREESEHY